MAERSSGPPDQSPSATGPASDLGEVWELLDSLPPAAAPRDMAATTVELAAARVARGDTDVSRAGLRGGWLGPALVVVAALLTGFVTGRATAPDPVLRQLPLIEHLGLLQEAGSVAFLESLASRMADRESPQARWFRLSRDPESIGADARDFETEVERLRVDLAAGDGAESLARRQARLEALPAADLAALERSAEAFTSLKRLARQDLEAVARALTDPRTARLREAARLWHVIVAATPPLFRQDVIDMDAERRLEWLQRPAGMEWRGGFPGRPRDDDRGDRRPPGQPRPPFAPDGGGQAGPGGFPGRPRPPFTPNGGVPPAGPPENPGPPR